MNSLLQALFMTPEFRSRLYGLPMEHLHVDKVRQSQRCVFVS